MRRIANKAELNSLVSAAMRPGVYTNCFLSGAEFEAEIAAGTLFASAGEGYLLLERRRGDHALLNFYVLPGADAAGELDGRLVTEIPFRPSDAGREGEITAFLSSLGFYEAFRRVRLMRPALNIELPMQRPEVRAARAEETEAVYALLCGSFDRFTGCIPPLEGFRREIEAGRVVCHFDGGEIDALLHYDEGRAASEIRHLAVREDRRGRGLAQMPYDEYLRLTGGGRGRVWANEENAPAIKFYTKNGYAPDGWRSVVLKRGFN